MSRIEVEVPRDKVVENAIDEIRARFQSGIINRINVLETVNEEGANVLESLIIYLCVGENQQKVTGLIESWGYTVTITD